MSTTDAARIQSELETLLAGRSRLSADDPRGRALDEKIAGLAEQLGLDPSELEGVGAALQEERSGQFVGEFFVRRRLSEVIYVPLGVALGAIVVGLEQPLGGLIIAAVIGLFVLRSATRVARIRVDEAGDVSLPGKIERIDWDTLRAVEFNYVEQTSGSAIERSAGGTVDVRFTLADGEVVRLARGPLWRARPSGPVGFVQLDRALKERARAARMKVERRSSGWIARR